MSLILEIQPCDGKVCGLGRHIAGGSYLCPHNNFAVLYPELSKEWDYERNKKGPHEYTCSSNVKTWWVCRAPENICGCHVWQAAISSRANRGSGCPFCNSGKPCSHNNLAVSHPELCKEWNYEKNMKSPHEYTYQSHIKVWWRCNACEHNCHVWETTIRHRAINNTECPFCFKGKVCAHNNLLIKRPDVCKEWDYKKNSKLPSEYQVNSGKKVWWRCTDADCNCHVWEAAIKSRSRQNGTGCPFCNKGDVCAHNNLLLKYPDICKEWDYDRNKLTPDQYAIRSNAKIWWRCSENPCGCHVWMTRISCRTREHGTNCPFCVSQKVCSHNNLLVLHPILSNEWNYERNIDFPSDYSSGSNIKVWWKCTKDHEWRAVIHSRTNKNSPTNCPCCSNSKQYSKAQIEWLELVMKEKNIQIQYVLSPGGEVSIPTVGKIDGYCYETHTVYEFHGDYWHGNPNVFHPDDINKSSNKTFGELYRKTAERDNRIRELGYNLMVKWETDLDPEIANIEPQLHELSLNVSRIGTLTIQRFPNSHIQIEIIS